jgi:hypothetical protein
MIPFILLITVPFIASALLGAWLTYWELRK